MTESEKKRVLLVEDEAITAMVEARQLRAAGYAVVHAPTGEAAVALLHGEAGVFDLVLMDIDLGRGMDGPEAAREILKFRDVPIVFLSSHTEKEIVEKTEEITSYGYVVKNSGETVLLASLKMAFKLFDAHRREREKEAALKKSEELYFRLFDRANDAIFLHELDKDGLPGHFLEVNARACESLGYGRDELLNLTVGEIASPGEAERFPALMVTLRREGGLTYESSHLRKDGTAFPVEVSTQLFEFQGRFLVLSIARDMTERKRVEADLQAANTTLSAVLDGVPADVYVADLETYRILFMNKTMKKNFGRDCTGELCYEAFRHNPGPCDHCTNSRLFDTGGRPGDVAVWEDFNPVTKKWWRNYDKAIFWVDGRKARIQFAVDISERKKMEEDLSRSSGEKEALLQELQHRVKNNLMMISSLINLEADRTEEPAFLSVLEKLKSRVDSLGDLYSILNLSGNVTEVRLDDYLRRLTATVKTACIKDLIGVKISEHFDPVRVSAKDAAPFGLILNELLTNALKYAFPGGSPGTVDVELRRTAGYLVLAVRDNGAGLPNDFDFRRLESFGLLLVRMLAEQIGGELSFENESGAAFFVRVQEEKILAARGPSDEG
jgi:PAS domain S-box-containing protein